MYKFYHNLKAYKKECYWVKSFFARLYSNEDLEFFSYAFIDIEGYSQSLHRCTKTGNISVIGIVYGNHLAFYHKNYPFSILLSDIV